MSRTRLIKPSFFKHADLYAAEKQSGLPLRVAFAGLWTVTDRDGRFRWKADIKPDVIPYDPFDILDVLEALERFGFVRRYVVAGKSYGLIPSFHEHQTFHKTERPSVLPPPSALTCDPPLDNREGHEIDTAVTGTVAVTGTSTVETALVDLQSTRVVPGARKRAKRPDASPIFALAWSLYPKRAGSNPRIDAESQWLARVREGAAEADMLAGTERYKAFCDAMNKTGTETVMQAKRFYGRNREFADAWDVPALAAAKPVESFAERREREAVEWRRIQSDVDRRRAKTEDGDIWWDRMRRESRAEKLGDVYRYAIDHTNEPGTLQEGAA